MTMPLIIEDVVDSADGPVGIVFEVTTEPVQSPPGTLTLAVRKAVLATYHFGTGGAPAAPWVGEPEK